jgi:GTP-binding protein
MVLDAKEGVSEQDAHILGFVMESGRSLVVAINKWDGLDTDHKARVKHELDIKLPFIKFAKIHTISALHGTGVGDLYNSIKQAYRSAMKQLSTPMLTNLLESLIFAHQPPLVAGRRIKLRYAHQGGKNPPIIIIHGNKTDQVPSSYRRYLENAFIEKLKLVGTPVRVEFKGGTNPYADKKNKLTDRQLRSKKRLVQHIKKKDKKRKSR